MDFHDNIDFIARKYRHGCFDTEKALRQIKPHSSFFKLRKWIAAACVAFVILGAGAFVLINGYQFTRNDTDNQVEKILSKDLNAVKVIDFDDVPLTDVVVSIKEIYGVEVVNVPENANDLRLSLHYSGNVSDLVETINEILGTELKIKDE